VMISNLLSNCVTCVGYVCERYQVKQELVQRVQSQLNSALLRCDRLTETATSRVEALGVRLANAAASALEPYEHASLTLRHMESDVQV
jgi:hypothetical protein